MKRGWLIGFIVLDALIMVGVVWWVISATSPPVPPPLHAHQLFLHEDQASWYSGDPTQPPRQERVLSADPNGQKYLALDPAYGTEVGDRRRAVFYSEIIKPASHFNEVLMSWNAIVPEGAGVQFELIIHDDESNASPPLYVGRAGAVDVDVERRTAFSVGKRSGRIDVDYFTSDDFFVGAQYKITADFTDSWTGAPVAIRRIALSFTLEGERALEDGGYATNILPVPFRSQRVPDASLAGRLCSPTSVTMVLAHHGVDLPVETVASSAFDADFDIYGNWPRNVQAAYGFGIEGYVRRFGNWNEVAATLAQGIPIIASIQVKPGELPAAPYEKTDGHLIVIRGLDEAGNVHVSDPAASTPEDGERVYSREGMTTVWLERVRGTAYVLVPPSDAPKAN